MTQAYRIVRHILTKSLFWLNLLVALLWPQKNLYTDRFATEPEVQSLAHNTANGLVLGVDRFGRVIAS